MLSNEAKDNDFEDNDQNSKMALSPVESQFKRQARFSEITIEIVKHWYNRASRLKKIRSQIAGLMQQHMFKEKCEFCKRTWGLRSECMESVEDMFQKFLKENKYQKVEDIAKWQSYFYKNAILRTICFSCSEEILENKTKMEGWGAKAGHSMIKMRKVSIDEGWKKKVNKRIIKMWLEMARKNLAIKKSVESIG